MGFYMYLQSATKVLRHFSAPLSDPHITPPPTNVGSWLYLKRLSYTALLGGGVGVFLDEEGIWF